MTVPIIKYGSQILRKHCTEVTAEDNPRQLSANLFDTIKKADGIGLAAPQIGLLKRIFILDTTPLWKENNEVAKVEQVYINPEILWKSNNLIYYKEGCLSIPEIFEDVLRPDKVSVRYFDVNFNLIEEELNGLKARIFQHEYDHLEGILFIDKLSTLKRNLLKGKLNKISRVKS